MAGKGQRKLIPATAWFVDVQDTALLHLSAIADPSFCNERVWCAADAYNFTDIAHRLARLFPDRDLPSEVPQGAISDAKIDNKRGEVLLRRLGRPGWNDLDATLRANVQHLV
jgi:nucleoside-diphosphate-sugar epimerase